MIIDDISRDTDYPEGDTNADVFIVAIDIVDLPNLRQRNRALPSGFILSPNLAAVSVVPLPPVSVSVQPAYARCTGGYRWADGGKRAAGRRLARIERRA